MPKWIRDLRKEAASHRTKLRSTQAELDTTKSELKKYTDKDKTDVERATTEASELRESLNQTQREMQTLRVSASAQRLGAQDPEAVEKLIDWGDVKTRGISTDDAVKELLEAKPYLKAPEKTDDDEGDKDDKSKKPKDSKTSAGTPSSSKTSQPKTFKKSEVRKLAADDPDAFNELYENGGLKEAMNSGRLVD
jgi:hypothetical protein